MRALALALLFSAGLSAETALGALNKGKPLMDAHNCYPYEGRWADRLNRALSTGFPVAIEQDLAWHPERGVVVSHEVETTGEEPTLEEHFFQRVRPTIEKALREGDRDQWPLIVLHFDIKDNRIELFESLWDLLGKYESWITTAKKTADPNGIAPLRVRPLAVLTENNDLQEQAFYNRLRVGDTMRLFGSAHTAKVEGDPALAKPEELLPTRATNYRRWWNNSWAIVEQGGQRNAGDWTEADRQRLQALVDNAHDRGYWVRFYTLDGFAEEANQGWSKGYNLGSEKAAAERWKAAAEAGVDMIATDHYEAAAQVIREGRR